MTVFKQNEAFQVEHDRLPTNNIEMGVSLVRFPSVPAAMIQKYGCSSFIKQSGTYMTRHIVWYVL